MAIDPVAEAEDEAAEAAAYVTQLAADLASLARRHGLDTLGYLLDMARLEAENVNRRHRGGDSPTAALRER